MTFQQVDRGERKAFAVRYRKTTAEPSVAKPPPTLDVATPSKPLNTTALALGLLAGVTILYAGGALFCSGRRRRKALRTSGGDHATSPARAEMHFCTHCGRALQPTFVFCPGCGRPLPQG